MEEPLYVNTGAAREASGLTSTANTQTMQRAGSLPNVSVGAATPPPARAASAPTAASKPIVVKGPQAVTPKLDVAEEVNKMLAVYTKAVGDAGKKATDPIKGFFKNLRNIVTLGGVRRELKRGANESKATAKSTLIDSVNNLIKDPKYDMGSFNQSKPGTNTPYMDLSNALGQGSKEDQALEIAVNGAIAAQKKPPKQAWGEEPAAVKASKAEMIRDLIRRTDLESVSQKNIYGKPKNGASNQYHIIELEGLYGNVPDRYVVRVATREGQLSEYNIAEAKTALQPAAIDKPGSDINGGDIKNSTDNTAGYKPLDGDLLARVNNQIEMKNLARNQMILDLNQGERAAPFGDSSETDGPVTQTLLGSSALLSEEELQKELRDSLTAKAPSDVRRMTTGTSDSFVITGGITLEGAGNNGSNIDIGSISFDKTNGSFQLMTKDGEMIVNAVGYLQNVFEAVERIGIENTAEHPFAVGGNPDGNRGVGATGLADSRDSAIGLSISSIASISDAVLAGNLGSEILKADGTGVSPNNRYFLLRTTEEDVVIQYNKGDLRVASAQDVMNDKGGLMKSSLLAKHGKGYEPLESSQYKDAIMNLLSASPSNQPRSASAKSLNLGRQNSGDQRV